MQATWTSNQAFGTWSDHHVLCIEFAGKGQTIEKSHMNSTHGHMKWDDSHGRM